MKQATARLLQFVVCTCALFGSQALARVNFGSRNSAIRARAGANFHASSSQLVIDGGTLAADPNAFISGNVIAFDEGVLDNDVIELKLTGSYDPTDPDLVILPGNGKCRATPGTVIQDMEVQNGGNRLEGQPLFTNPIVFQNSSAQLIVALNNKLNRPMVLNGGNLVLDGDLALADGVKVDGPGIIDFNNCQLSLGSTYDSPWSDPLYWRNAADLALNGYTSLTSIWTFSGVSVLNGNGSVLDLRNGGQLVVDTGSTLYLNDIHITGLGNGDTNGKIRCTDNSGQIVMADFTCKLDANFTTSIGNILVNGPATWMLGAKNWTFDQNGSLTVDGVTLWIDGLDTSCPASSGQVNAPLPVFASNANLLADLAAGNLSLVNHGTIKLMTDASEFPNLSDECLFDMPLTNTLVLDCNICLCSDQFIRVAANICIDGQGASICFSDAHHAQLTVEAGKILTLKNVCLLNINQDVIDLRPGARIHIMNDVCWGLSENITFSNGLLRLIEGPNGPNIFRLKGDHCRRDFNVSPLLPLTPSGQFRKIFNLNTNTVQLESVALGGFSAIDQVNGATVVGATALSCNAAVNIDVNTNMNFFVEGVANNLVLQNDGINLSGNISFGDLPSNELGVQFALTSPLNPNDPARAGVRPDNPFFILSGNPGILLTSAGGNAHLTFQDLGATVNNANNNGFIIDQHSWLSANSLQILTNPVKQQSASFRLEAIEVTGQKIDPSFIRSTIDGLVPLDLRRVMPQCAFAKMRQRERDDYAQLQAMLMEVEKQLHPGSKQKQPSKQQEQADGVREIQEPAGQVYDQTFVDTSQSPANPITNTIHLIRSELLNFRVLAGTPCTVTMQGSPDRPSLIEQAAMLVDLKTGQKINVIGRNNVIRVTNTMRFGQDTLLFDAAAPADLVIELVNDGNNNPTVKFAAGTTLTLEKHSTLRFKGRGTVIFEDGTVVHLNGTATFSPAANGAFTITSRPSIMVEDEVVMTLAKDGMTRVNGIGGLRIAGGQLNLSYVSSLIFGVDQAYADLVGIETGAAERLNNLEVIVEQGGQMVLSGEQGGALGGRARVSAQFGGLTFRVIQGLVDIGQRGLLEFNANSGAPVKGLLQEFTICFGGLTNDGLLRFGPNKPRGGTSTPGLIPWCLTLGQFAGKGCVQYVDPVPASGFAGLVSSAASSISQPTLTPIAAKDLVTKLIQQQPTFINLIFKDCNSGATMIKFASNGAIVQVLSTDMIFREDANGNVLAIDANGGTVRYSANGQRQVVRPLA